MQYAIWILMILFCLTRVVFWILAATLHHENPNGTVGKILYAVVGSSDLFWFLMPLAPQPRLQTLPWLWRAIGLVLVVGGVLIMRKGLGQFNGAGVSLRPDVTPPKLVTEGVYSIVRHPLYVSLTFIFAGWSLIWTAVYSLWFVIVFILLNVLNAVIEERYILRRAFGEAHDAYRQRVGMFIPKF